VALPNYYTSLKPFRKVFASGTPILTYHHVGPRPKGARLKGLYVGEKLFAQQMAELAAAGYSTANYQEVLSHPANKIFVTFDDGFVDVLQHGLPVLNQHKFTSIQFLVAGLIGKTNEWQQKAGDVSESLMNHEQAREWLAAGQQIGSHTLTHPRLSQIPVSAAVEEISSSKKKLEDIFGIAVKHFCYPYGDWNQSVRDAVQEAGYETACVTKRGVNTAGTDRYALLRFTARYRSRTWRNLFSWLGQ
jgi:peptidoglycan/xylan/chitin deacetylase (PgdA/CDA1 family)